MDKSLLNVCMQETLECRDRYDMVTASESIFFILNGSKFRSVIRESYSTIIRHIPSNERDTVRLISH